MAEKVGRKRAVIDRGTFERLCALQGNKEEIAFALKVAHNTLNAWCKDTYNDTFKNVFAIYRQAGFLSLRRELFKQSKTSPKVLLFMATNYLGLTNENPQPQGTSVTTDTVKAFSESLQSLKDAEQDFDTNEEEPNHE